MFGRRQFRVIGAAAVTAALVLAACGSDDEASESTDASPAADTSVTSDDSAPADTSAPDSTDAPTDPTTAATVEDSVPSTADVAADPLGEPNPATGSVVKIGMINNEGGEGALDLNSKQYAASARMAIDYYNEYMGGIGGHEIEFVLCKAQGTPAGALSCANQLVQDGVVAVIEIAESNGDSIVPIFTAAGIPYITGTPLSTQELTTPGAYGLTGGVIGAIGIVAQDAVDEGFTKVAAFVLDVPSVTQASDSIGGLVAANAGIEWQTVAIPLGTPDMTPQLQAAESDGVESIMVISDTTFCGTFLKGYQSLAMTQKRYVLTTCMDASLTSTQPDTLIGANLIGPITDADEDAALYAAIVDKYAPDDLEIDPNPLVSASYAFPTSVYMSFLAMMDGIGEDVTTETVHAQMGAATDVPLFLGGGITMTCDGTAIAILPNVCSSESNIGTLDDELLPTDIKLVDPSSLFG